MSQYYLSAGGGGSTVTGTGTDKHVVRWDGTGVPVIQDGVALETDLGAFQTSDGTLALPSYSFLSDPSAGMYTDTGVVYIVANSNSLLELDGTNQTADINAITTITETLQVDDVVTFNSGQVVKVTSSAISLNVDATMFQILITDTSAPRTVTLPAAPTAGTQFRIKDATGAAGTNNITVDVTGGVVTIDGATSQVININYGFMTVLFDGTEYFIVG